MQTCVRLGIKPEDRVLLVRISTQTLQFYRNTLPVKSYVISTSLRPPSNVKDSQGTPTGLHTIAERIGCTEGQVKQRRVTLNLPPRAVGNQRSSNRNESAANYWTAFESADRAFSAAVKASAGEGFTDARVAPHSNVHRSYRDLPEAHGWRSPMADA